MSKFVHIPAATEVTDDDEISAIAKMIMQVETVIGLDTETSGLDTVNDHIYCWSMATRTSRWCLPFRALENQDILDLLEGTEIDKVLTNAKFDLHMFANAGVRIGGNIFDTVVMDAYYDDTEMHGLKECTKRYLNIGLPSFQDVFGSITNRPTHSLACPFCHIELIPSPASTAPTADLIKEGTKFKCEACGSIVKKKDLVRVPYAAMTALDLLERADPVRRADYASMDAWASLQVYDYLKGELSEMDAGGSTLWELYTKQELHFTRLLWVMEREGIHIDTGHLRRIEAPVRAGILAIEKKFMKEAQVILNLNSNPQIQEFFEKRGLVSWKFTKGGQTGEKKPSVDKSVLQKWAADGDPFASMLLDYRAESKLLNTYVIGLRESVDSEFRIHTTYNQAGARTGRLSSSDPNLQNIPSKTDRYGIRKAFVAFPPEVLIVADYSQLEMRIMAHLSRDKAMVDAINSGMDLHCLTASKLLNVPYDSILAAKKKQDREEVLTADEERLLLIRYRAKTLGFGILYGMGAPKLSTELRITKEEAMDLIEAYFDAFPLVRAWCRRTVRFCRDNGFVMTIAGRRRYLPIHAVDFKVRAEAERGAVNTPIQGSAADIVKTAQLKCMENAWVQAQNRTPHYVKQVLQVHDELVFRVHEAVAEQAKDVIKHEMEHALEEPLLVALPVSIHVGFRWADAK